MNGKTIISAILAASMILSTGTTITLAKKKKKKVSLNVKSKKLKKGKSFTLKLKGTKKTGKASASNKKVIKVKKKKKNQWSVKAIKAGKSTITVKVGKKKYKCKVTVVKSSKTSTNTNNTTLSEDQSLANLATKEINALPSVDALTLNDELKVASAKTSYDILTPAQKALVDQSVVDKLNKCVQKINDLKVEKEKRETTITIGDNGQLNNIMVGGTVQIDAYIQSTYYKTTDVTFSSSNNQIATVDANGKVTGVSKGTATITAQVGDHTAQCNVNVHDLEISLPTLPATFSNSLDGTLRNKFIIQNVSIEKTYYSFNSNEFDLKLNYTGENIYSNNGSSRMLELDYKLFDENNVVVKSGEIITDSVFQGNKFSGSVTIDLLKEGSYRLVFYDVHD